MPLHFDPKKEIPTYDAGVKWIRKFYGDYEHNKTIWSFDMGLIELESKKILRDTDDKSQFNEMLQSILLDGIRPMDERRDEVWKMLILSLDPEDIIYTLCGFLQDFCLDETSTFSSLKIFLQLGMTIEEILTHNKSYIRNLGLKGTQK